MGRAQNFLINSPMLPVARPHFCCILSGPAASQQPLAVVACCCCCFAAVVAVTLLIYEYLPGNVTQTATLRPSAAVCQVLAATFATSHASSSRLSHSAPPVACRLHNEPQPNKVKFIKSTEEKPKRMPKSRKTNENEILSECKSAIGRGGRQGRYIVRGWEIGLAEAKACTRTHVLAMQKTIAYFAAQPKPATLSKFLSGPRRGNSAAAAARSTCPKM